MGGEDGWAGVEDGDDCLDVRVGREGGGERFWGEGGDDFVGAEEGGTGGFGRGAREQQIFEWGRGWGDEARLSRRRGGRLGSRHDARHESRCVHL